MPTLIRSAPPDAFLTSAGAIGAVGTRRIGGVAASDEADRVVDAAMGRALELAAEAAAAGEVPVGAVVVAGGRVVAARRNEREASGDPTAHAEVLALRDAAATLGRRRLHDATLVVTLEPCPLCAGAVWAAQVGRVVFGAADPRAGAMGSLYSFAADPRLNHRTEVRPGLRAAEASALLTAFFRDRR